MRKILTVISIIILLVSCAKKQNKEAQTVITKAKVVEAYGYGDNEKNAVKDALTEAKLIGFGSILDVDRNLTDIVCLKDSIISKNVDDIGMWTVKIKAHLKKQNM